MELLGRAAEVEDDLAVGPVGRVEGTNRGRDVAGFEEFRSEAGVGVRATVGGAAVAVGGPRMAEQAGWSIPSPLADASAAWSRAGRTVLVAAIDDRVVAVLAVEDEIRPESREAIDDLHRLGVRVAMLTGDSRAVASSVMVDVIPYLTLAPRSPRDLDFDQAAPAARS